MKLTHYGRNLNALLEINHRQGEDKEYAAMLNRIRIGDETLEDIDQLK